ncbi:NAD(P)/FAD-dependent oxidoreductase [Arenibacterium sp. CAU 1754]
MTRIFSDHAYGPGPRQGCWWDETISAPDWPVLDGDMTVDVAIVGGGFTGVSAALHLAESGASAALFESDTPGWGASGRNGGFCCLGGAMIENAALTRRFGAKDAAAYWQAERDAVTLVADLLKRHAISTDVHSKGETILAHRPRDMEALRRKADAMARDAGPPPELIEPADLRGHGMGGPFHGGLTVPVGFALNPRKYLFGLAAAAQRAGAFLFQQTRVTSLSHQAGRVVLGTPHGRVRAGQVVIATNGYSSEDMPGGLAGRYMPAQSNVMVTRPLSDAELQAQGWTSGQMAYDTRGLLHYFRLMPDRRFLFGMRGGLLSSPAAEARARAATRRDFDRLFPAWRHVEAPHMWSGMVCLSRNRVPFAGPVTGQPGVFAGMAYHGNGVAMGSFTGRLLADLVQGQDTVPRVMRQPPGRFPFGRARRIVMPPFYIARALGDR